MLAWWPVKSVRRHNVFTQIGRRGCLAVELAKRSEKGKKNNADTVNSMTCVPKYRDNY